MMMSEVALKGGVMPVSKKVDAFFQILNGVAQDEQSDTDGQ